MYDVYLGSLSSFLSWESNEWYQNFISNEILPSASKSLDIFPRNWRKTDLIFLNFELMRVVYYEKKFLTKNVLKWNKHSLKAFVMEPKTLNFSQMLQNLWSPKCLKSRENCIKEPVSYPSPKSSIMMSGVSCCFATVYLPRASAVLMIRMAESR